MRLKGSEIACEALLREGVDVLFGYPGGAVLPFYDALYKYQDRLRHILVRHEQSAAHAANAYYRVSGRMGVCVATSGPGATNLVTGLMDAKADSVPLVAITGQVARPFMGKEAFQECPTVDITAPCTKKNYLVMSASDVAPTLYDAFRTAVDGRPGPVLVDLPRDVQQEEAEFEYPINPPAPNHMALSPEALKNLRRAALLLAQAKRPLILAGHGVLISRAWDELLALAERINVPVINTLLGLTSFPRNHRLSLGMLGMHGMYWCNQAVDQADVILGLGMRFDDRVTGRPGTFAPNAQIVHVDVEPKNIGRNVRVEVPVVADLKAALQALLPMVGQAAPNNKDWLEQIEAWKRDHNSLYVPEDVELPAQYVLSELNKLLQEDREAVVTTGVGQHQMWSAQFLFLDRPNSFVTSGSLGTMGFELPSAVGAQVGRPDSTVWSIAGDGGFQMSMHELATMVEHELPVKIVIMNNRHLGMVRQWQDMFYDKHIKETPLMNPDFVKLADAFGIPAVRVTRREDVSPALRRARAHRGPFLLEMVVEPEGCVFPMVAPGKTLAETMEDPRSVVVARATS